MRSLQKNGCAIILLIVLLIYFGAICLINFSVVPSFYDSDMYSDLLFLVEVWENKSIFPEGWVFGNQLNVVSTPVLAAFFYGIIRNPNIAMALASSIMSVFVILSYDWMLKPVLKTIKARLMAAVIMLTVILFYGDAVYGNTGWTLLFTMCSYYSGYSITAFLAFGCYLRSDRMDIKNNAVILALTCMLSFGTGIQSIRQTVIMVLPMIAVEILRMLWCFHHRQFYFSGSIVTGAVSVSNVMGLIFVKKMEINQNEIFGEIIMTPPGEVLEAVRKCFLMVLSLLSNSNLESYIILGIVFLFCVASLFDILKNEREISYCKPVVLFNLLIMSFLAIVAIDVLTTMYVRPRYYFILFPLIGFMIGYGFERWGKQMQAAMLVLTVLFFGIACDRELKDVCDQARNQEHETAYNISDYLLANGYTTVYSVWGHGEDVAVASQGIITAGYWDSMENPFEPVKYLCNPDIFSEQAECCVYLFDGYEAAKLGEQAALECGVELKLLKFFSESDEYVYSANVNLMNINEGS